MTPDPFRLRSPFRLAILSGSETWWQDPGGAGNLHNGIPQAHGRHSVCLGHTGELGRSKPDPRH